MESLTLYDWCHWELDVDNKKPIRDNGYTTCNLLMALRECILLECQLHWALNCWFVEVLQP